MEHFRLRNKSVVEFTDQLKVKRNDVARVIGKPTYSLYKCKPVLDAFKMNLINMEDWSDNIWKQFHLVTNTSQLHGGPA